jgi:protein-S-isoprenylcysteine O-methyltransferase Ste14
MFEKTLMTLAAAAAIAAAAAVSVVALAFAFYQVMQQWVGPAGAAASVAGAFALFVFAAGLIAANKAGAGRRREQAVPVDNGLVNTLIGIVRDRPILSAGAAVAAGIFALRNPAFLSAVVQGFMDSQRKRD